MKISLLTDGIHPYVLGGMQKYAYYLCKYLAKNQVYVDLYHFIPLNSKEKNPFSDEELKYITLIEVPWKRYKFKGHYIYENYIFSKKIYKKFVRREKPDFVYAQGFTGWYLMKKGIRVGVNNHGYEMFQDSSLKLGLLRWGARQTMKKADSVFSYGGKISEIIKKITSSKIIEMNNGIEEEWLTKVIVKHKKPHFLFVGRNDPRKGIENLNLALESFNGDFHFVGPLPKEKQIDKKNIFYHGKVTEKELKEIYSKCDVLVCPSYSEGMPTVILEAMASGLAIIATDVGVVFKMVSDNGWLLENNNPDTIKQAMLEAVNSDLTEKRKKSLEKAKQFTWDKIVKDFLEKIK
jgi:glycosyltransferase involved in cell wall biosynthesis